MLMELLPLPRMTKTTLKVHAWLSPYSGYHSHTPSNDFFPLRKLNFGGCQSNASMTITASGVSRTLFQCQFSEYTSCSFIFT